MSTSKLSGARGTTFLLGQLGNLAVKGTRNQMAAQELHPRQFVILSILKAEPELSQQTLSDRILVHRSAMVGLIDDLETRGLVTRERRADNRREHALTLTNAGRELEQQLSELTREFEDVFLETLDQEERLQLVSLLQKLAESHKVATYLSAKD